MDGWREKRMGGANNTSLQMKKDGCADVFHAWGSLMVPLSTSSLTVCVLWLVKDLGSC